MDAPERCSQAFTVAAVAAVSGTPTSLWLTGEASWLAVPGRAAQFHLEFATPLQDLLGDILEFGSLTVCSQCAARRDIEVDDLIAGATISGAASFVAAVTAPDAQALVY